MARALIVQLARLGDLLQTLPVIAALKAQDPEGVLDLLCPAHLASVARQFPGIAQVLEWDGPAWRDRAVTASARVEQEHVAEADRYLGSLVPNLYDRAYVLNQHARALLAGALLARDTQGPRLHGLLDERLSPWATYLREVARTRRGRQVHLADAFCGLCGVDPPGKPPTLNPPAIALPPDLDKVGTQGGPWIGLIVGAGDPERLIPLPVWREWIVAFCRAVPGWRLVLVGQEQERARQIQETLPSSVLGRIWDAAGRTSLLQLTAILARCRTVIGADTGPLHLAAAVGTHVIGWYFGRARVHDTGPYGTQHLIWQATGTAAASDFQLLHPSRWPIEETIAGVLGRSAAALDGWSLWTSHCDRWGAYYVPAGCAPIAPPEREALWRTLQPVLRS